MWLPLSQLHRGSRWQWVNDGYAVKGFPEKHHWIPLGTLQTQLLAFLNAFAFSILGWLSDLSVRFCIFPWRCKRLDDLHQRQEREARSISGALAHYTRMMALDFQVFELSRLAYVLSSNENYWLYFDGNNDPLF